MEPAPEDLTERFAKSLARVWPGHGGEVRLGLAVSGGPDSLALLVMAAKACSGRIEAATVNHGLRPESRAEAEAVAAVCASLGVPHETLAVTVAAGNVQAEARDARYAALAEWAERRGLAAIATAHHADDQAETLLLRLNRGSGVAGLAGVRAAALVRGTRLPLLRPLLDWRRRELGEVVANAGLVAADDPSNRNPRFDRVRMRQALAGADWLDVPALARSAANLADAETALEWAAAREWSENVAAGAMGSYVYRPQAPRAIALRVVALLVARLDGSEPRGGQVAQAFEALLKGRPVSLGNVVVRPSHEGWSFMPAPRRRT